MKIKQLFTVFVLLLVVLQSCNYNSHEEQKNEQIQHLDSLKERLAILKDSIVKTSMNKTLVPSLGDILDSNDVEGSIVIYKVSSDTWSSNDYVWANKRRLPASTFKIVNSIIGLETNVVSDAGIEFMWDGKPRRMKQWEKDFDLKGAFHASCVPCYQDLARRIGVTKMNAFLESFSYGHMEVDSNSLDRFWLEGESGVSQMEQIHFLRKFYNNELGLHRSTTESMKSVMVIDSNASYKLSGKTGWSIRNGNNNGWFVGCLETSGEVYFFATNVTPKETFNMSLFSKIRSQLTMKAFEHLGVLPN